MAHNKIYFVGGARPQFIKLAPVLRAMQDYSDCKTALIHTGQHYDANLSADFFAELTIQSPIINLACGSGTPAYQYAQIISSLSRFLELDRPDLLVVIGDTNSTGAAAVTASLMGIRLAHIEAGLREFDRSIPEEVNKIITDRLAEIYFCPSKTAVDNLKAENVTGEIIWSGDPGLDLLFDQPLADGFQAEVLINYGLEKGAYYFATVHRQINTDNSENLKNILQAFCLLPYPVIIPLHPRTKKAISHFGLLELINNSNIHIIDPIGFWETQVLINNAEKVLTDSGGIIKECYFHNKYVIVLDRQTEWVEVISEGKGIVCGSNKDCILAALQNDLPSKSINTSFGTGDASRIIAAALASA